jgi:TPR repeat protein
MAILWGLLVAGVVLTTTVSFGDDTAVTPEPSAALDKHGCHSREYIAAQMEEFGKQAARGDAAAAYKLSFMYRHGQIRDKAKSHAFLVQAAEGGIPEAEYGLGMFYFFTYSKPAPTDRTYSVCVEHADDIAKWLKRAAEHGEYNAQLALAESYMKGDCGFPLDPVEAYKWAVLGGSDTASYATILKMTPDQIAAARERAAAWSGPPHKLETDLHGLEWKESDVCCAYEHTCDNYYMIQLSWEYR